MKETALITGASRGIGAECARALARDGYRVIINYLNSEAEALSLADELGSLAVRADVSDPAQVDKMFETALANSGPVSVLVNNAGISIEGLVTDLSADDWRKIFAVNCDGVFYCSKAAVKGMIHYKRGSIINISSVWGVLGASCEAAYSASKAAVIGFTKSLAKELGPSGIRVNCIAPGVIQTDMNSRYSPSEMEALRGETALGAIGTPHQVAEAVAFLASERADFITGQVLGVDGGFPF